MWIPSWVQKPLLKLPADDVTIVQVAGDTELLNL
jgi:hypothetical protein